MQQIALVVTGLIATVTCLTEFKRLFFDFKGQGGVSSRAIAKERLEEQKGVYEHAYYDPTRLSNSDYNPQQTSLKGRPSEMTVRNLRNATVSFHSNDGKMKRITSAINVRGNVYMCNNHGIPLSEPFELTVVGRDDVAGLRSVSNKILVTPSMVQRDPTHDLAFIRLRGRPPGRDLTNLFCKDDYIGELQGIYPGIDENGKLWETEVFGLKLTEETFVSHGLTIKRPCWRGKVQTPTQVGDCGTALFSNTPAGHIILGIHTLGVGSHVAAMKVTDSTVRKYCDLLEEEFIEPGCVQVSAPSAERWL